MKPLEGRRIMITRPERQAGGLRDKLEALGATVDAVPVVAIAPPDDPESLKSAIRNLGEYDWLVLTSVNGVEAVRIQTETLGIGIEGFPDLKIAAIGSATARALEEWYRAPDLVPDEYVSEAIAKALPDIKGHRFLLARADLARKDLAEELRAKGAEVDEITAYRIVRNLAARLPDRAPDAITFTSAEVARATYDLLDKEDKIEWMKYCALACIGPITAAAVQKLGFEPTAVAGEYDNDGLIAALVKSLGREATHA